MYKTHILKATLIISVYKDVEALRAIFRSLLFQTEKAFAVIIAQDADENCFQELIAEFQERGLKIQLLQQEDNGFQKNKILNKAIQTANAEKLIFIDGDCVLHPKFIEAHVKMLRQGGFCAGKRVDLDEKTSALIRQGEIVTPSVWQLLKNGAERTDETFRFLIPFKGNGKTSLIGCNMSWCKSDLERLNGFDEDYKTPGYGEDTDVEYRALQLGMKIINVRYRAIQYHLHHARPEREDQVEISRQLFKKKHGL